MATVKMERLEPLCERRGNGKKKNQKTVKMTTKPDLVIKDQLRHFLKGPVSVRPFDPPPPFRPSSGDPFFLLLKK